MIFRQLFSTLVLATLLSVQIHGFLIMVVTVYDFSSTYGKFAFGHTSQTGKSSRRL